MDKKTQEFLDSFSEEELLAFLYAIYGIKEPQYEECSKEEYESVCGTKDGPFTLEILEKMLCSDEYYKYRCIPYWNNGGGILNQISGREPDGYRYQKLVGYKDVIPLGGDIYDYYNNRFLKTRKRKKYA